MENNKITQVKKVNPILSWLFRLFKGMVIGIGFIIPGVSGGVFAAIFGVYEPMIRFFANIRKNFMKNVFFFLPIGIGGIVSIVLMSKVLDVFFESNRVPLVWFFIGCVAGTLPLLFAQARKNGRKVHHYAILVIVGAVTYLVLLFMEPVLGNISVNTNNPITWLFSGALMGLGAIIPGLSPSNFLLYLNIYDDMIANITKPMVIIPVIAGAMLCFLLLSKLFGMFFDKYYGGMFHAIIGIIIASSIIILPLKLTPEDAFTYNASGVVICIIVAAAGFALGYVMGLQHVGEACAGMYSHMMRVKKRAA